MGSYEQSFAGGAEQGLTPLSRACFVSCQSLVLPELGRNPAPIAYQRREELHADDCQGAGHEKKVSHAGSRSHDDLDTTEIRGLRWPNTIGAASATPTAASPPALPGGILTLLVPASG